MNTSNSARARTSRKYCHKVWREKPGTMLKKVAIAQAFRLAFPDEMGSLPYTAEEMPVQHETLNKGPVEVVETKREPVKETKKETAGAPPEPTDSPSTDSDPAASDDITDMAENGPGPDDRGAEEGAQHEYRGDQDGPRGPGHRLQGLQKVPSRDPIPSQERGKGFFVRLKFGHPSLEEGNRPTC